MRVQSFSAWFSAPLVLAAATLVPHCAEADSANDGSPGWEDGGSADSLQEQDSGHVRLPKPDGSNDSEGCASASFAATLTPLDLYVLFDASSSMACDGGGYPPPCDAPDWPFTKLANALKSFTSDPASAGLGVALGYFPVPGGPAFCTTDAECGPFGPCSNNGGASYCMKCDSSGYESPAVPMQALPAAAPALSVSLDSVLPWGASPGLYGLQGAAKYMKGWLGANPTHLGAVVIFSDGKIGGCGFGAEPSVVSVVEDALDGQPSVPTYVVAPEDPSKLGLEHLHQIASAGGTVAPFLLQQSALESSFLETLNEIRSQRLGCSFEVPQGRSADLDHVNVEVDGVLVPLDPTAACDPDAATWHYNASKTAIELCGSACADAKSETATVEIVVGCQTVVVR